MVHCMVLHAPASRTGACRPVLKEKDNNRVFECPAKLVRRLVRRLSGTSIGISKTPCLSSSLQLVSSTLPAAIHGLGQHCDAFRSKYLDPALPKKADRSLNSE